jgi:hypothetical protein
VAAEAEREREAARAFLTGDADENGDGVVDAEEAADAAEAAGDSAAELMDAGTGGEVDAEVTEQVFDAVEGGAGDGQAKTDGEAAAEPVEEHSV